ncbi:hypothetical protein [Mesobacillus foraminis]|nr:hypothetical protein [Mesobacillus foraminis]
MWKNTTLGINKKEKDIYAKRKETIEHIFDDIKEKRQSEPICSNRSFYH